ncbi:hypothetical protein [Bdellovibrio sp. HCB274]|uniref:hypothetical protein n=1 Tax=Bdellovibrio sp. HCB274 TaxID=3394361 RepID=UPI0039B5BDC5
MKAFWFIAVSAFVFLAAPVSIHASVEKPTVAAEITIDDVSGMAQYYSYTFPNTPTYYTRYSTFRLTNNADCTVRVHGVMIWGGAYSFNSNCYGKLRPGESCYTQVGFRPMYQGYHNGQLRFDLSSGTVYLNLYGWGVYY